MLAFLKWKLGRISLLDYLVSKNLELGKKADAIRDERKQLQERITVAIAEREQAGAQGRRVIASAQ